MTLRLLGRQDVRQIAQEVRDPKTGYGPGNWEDWNHFQRRSPQLAVRLKPA